MAKSLRIMWPSSTERCARLRHQVDGTCRLVQYLENRNMTKEDQKMKYLALAGLFAAMITIMTAYLFHIPYGINGGYIHFGDMLIYLAACILPHPYAMAAAAIGAGLADLLTAPMWAPATVVIKILMTIGFTRKGRVLCARNVSACALGMVINIIGYFLAECLLFGTKVAFIASATGNLVQSLGSAALFIAAGALFDHSRAFALPPMN